MTPPPILPFKGTLSRKSFFLTKRASLHTAMTATHYVGDDSRFGGKELLAVFADFPIPTQYQMSPLFVIYASFT
jgi:hypothetical protein